MCHVLRLQAVHQGAGGPLEQRRGGPQRNLICKLSFQVDGQGLEVESASNGSLAAIGQNEYKVCAVRGYAVDSSKGEIPLKHENMRGCPRKWAAGVPA